MFFQVQCIELKKKLLETGELSCEKVGRPAGTLTHDLKQFVLPTNYLADLYGDKNKTPFSPSPSRGLTSHSCIVGILSAQLVTVQLCTQRKPLTSLVGV